MYQPLKAYQLTAPAQAVLAIQEGRACAYRPMLLPFEQQLPPGVEEQDAAWVPPRRPARRTNQPPKGRLLGICPQGHGLTSLNSEERPDGSRACFLCQKNL